MTTTELPAIDRRPGRTVLVLRGDIVAGIQAQRPELIRMAQGDAKSQQEADLYEALAQLVALNYQQKVELNARRGLLDRLRGMLDETNANLNAVRNGLQLMLAAARKTSDDEDEG